jgi:DNA (cytosine-5)-methyltransferase 1
MDDASLRTPDGMDKMYHRSISRVKGEHLLIGSICTGYGGLETGVRDYFSDQQGIKTEVAWVADNDKAASIVLAERYPGVQNLSDITTVNWSEIQSVDMLCAGFPCQPFSQAGRKRGRDDERWIFDYIMGAVDSLGEKPEWIFLENVRGLLGVTSNSPGRRFAMAHVLGSLASRGYVGQYRVVSASECGAPFQGQRLFILARLSTASAPEHDGFTASEDGTADSQSPLPSCEHEDRSAHEGALRRLQSAGSSVVRATLRRVRNCTQQMDTGDWTTTPTGNELRCDLEDLSDVVPVKRLTPEFTEWCMGLSEGWVTGVPGLSRAQQFKLLGNGCVPQQAAFALSQLYPALADAIPDLCYAVRMTGEAA